MEVLITIGSSDSDAVPDVGSDTDLEVLERALVEAASSFVAAGSGSRAAVNVRASGAEWATLGASDTEREAVAMVKLWDASADTALAFPLPDSAHLVGAYSSNEVVQKDYEQTWPTGTQSPGVKMVCFVRRKPDLTHAEYLAHWRNNHGPLAVRVQPGFWHYVQNHVVAPLTDHTPDFDGIGELHYRTVDDVIHGSFADDEARRLIFEDIERFMVNETSTVLLSKETLVG